MISRPFTNWKLLRGWHDAPQIPLHLEQAARRVLAIPPEETLCVLYDDTLFATGENGFVLTPHRICWKAMGEASVSLLRTSLRTRDVYAKANRVFVGAGELPLTGWNEAMTASLAERLHQWIGQKYLARQAYRVSPPTRQHWTVDEALKRVQPWLTPSKRMHVYPRIASERVKKIRLVFDLASTETVVAVRDTSLLRSGMEGVMLTTACVLGWSAFEKPYKIQWVDLAMESVGARGGVPSGGRCIGSYGKGFVSHGGRDPRIGATMSRTLFRMTVRG